MNKEEIRFSEPADLTRRPRGSKLSEVMVREPESKGFPEKAGFEEKETRPKGRVGRKIEVNLFSDHPSAHPTK